MLGGDEDFEKEEREFGAGATVSLTAMRDRWRGGSCPARPAKRGRPQWVVRGTAPTLLVLLSTSALRRWRSSSLSTAPHTPMAVIKHTLAANEYGEAFQSANQLLPSRATQHPGEPHCFPFLARYADLFNPADLPVLGVTDAAGQAKAYTFSQLEAAVNLLATFYASVVPPRQPGNSTTKLTCALLAPSGFDCAFFSCFVDPLLLFTSPFRRFRLSLRH